MSFVALTQSMATLALLSAGLGLMLLLGLALPAVRARIIAGVEGGESRLMGTALTLALAASAGSLYYSEVVGFVPCSLCWYQRIAMYPLVPVLALALVYRDAVGAVRYGLALTLPGLLIALYHVTIQFRPSLDIGACSTGVSCTGRYLAVYGFVSIPVMAASIFVLILALLLTLRLANAHSLPSDPSSGHGPRRPR
jgi:hypothetical protein